LGNPPYVFEYNDIVSNDNSVHESWDDDRLTDLGRLSFDITQHGEDADEKMHKFYKGWDEPVAPEVRCVEVVRGNEIVLRYFGAVPCVC